MTNENGKWRERARRGLESYFHRRRFPRLTLGLLLILTGATGFGLSYLLLRAGLDAMWLRYPVAVLGAYGFFLLLMRLWVELERRQISPSDPELITAIENAKNLPAEQKPVLSEKRSWWEHLDVGSGLDICAAEGCIPALLLAAVIGLLVLLIAALAGAPVLLAEVLVDAFLAGVLYRRLKIAAQEHWLGTAIRKTWTFVLATAALLSLAGACLAFLAPGATSIGSALKQIFA